MTNFNESEPSLAALDVAANALRAANHARPPTPPESIYTRAGALIELVESLRQIAVRIGSDVEVAASDAAAHGHVLDSDDDVPAATYMYQARDLLADATLSSRLPPGTPIRHSPRCHT